MPVVDIRTIGNAIGGPNALRSYSGAVQILSPYATVLAGGFSAAGTPGANLLTSCLGLTNQGIVNPADLNTLDDAGVCSPTAPPASFTTAAALGVIW
jgi:hypothetical protein